MKVPEPRKLPSGTWFIQLRLGGESISVSALTKKDCIRQAELIKAQHRAAAQEKKYTACTVGQAVDEYIQKKAALSPTTLQGYEKIRAQYFQSLMDVPLKKLTLEKINDAIYSEQNRTSRRGKPLSAKTICAAWHLISTALKHKGVRFSEPPDLPEIKKKPVQILSFDEIYPAIKGSDIELECLLAAWMSLTISEIRGLTKSKSIYNGKLTIVETVVDVHNQPVRKEGGKETERVRVLDIPPYIQTLIDRVEGDVLCTKSSQTINKRYQRLLEKAGLPQSSFHKLRHTFASEAARLMIQPEIIQQIGGWKTPHIMKTVYTHTFAPPRLDADARMNAYYDSVVENANVVANESEK